MKDNVLRGIALLDEKRPRWRKKVNKDTLNMVWCDDCILGQVYGSYFVGIQKLNLTSHTYEIKGKNGDADDYGFETSTHHYNELQHLWKEQL